MWHMSDTDPIMSGVCIVFCGVAGDIVNPDESPRHARQIISGLRGSFRPRLARFLISLRIQRDSWSYRIANQQPAQ